MSRKWIDYVGAGGAVLAVCCYVFAIALTNFGQLEERSLFANLVVGYAAGFFGAWFVKKLCDFLKHPLVTFRWAWNLFGKDWLSRLIACVLVPVFWLLALAVILAPVLGSADKSTLVAVLVGATIFGEFSTPSYNLYLAEQRG